MTSDDISDDTSDDIYISKKRFTVISKCKGNKYRTIIRPGTNAKETNIEQIYNKKETNIKETNIEQ